jgi:hypothetical protein
MLTIVQNFEYKYRQDHKLLGTMMDFPVAPFRKPQDIESSRQGPISRAVRKLTPRKSSLVNLLKGKGWNRPEEMRPYHGWGERDPTLSLTQAFTMTSMRDLQHMEI